MHLSFREMVDADAAVVSKLVLEAFASINDDGFSAEGRESFINFVSPSAIASRIKCGYVTTLAVCDDEIVGVLELRDGHHISMLFVNPVKTNNYIGTRLLSRCVSEIRRSSPKVKQLTVHAVNSAVWFYLKRNFHIIASKQQLDGITYTTLAFPLQNNTVLDRKINKEPIEFYVFSGTGNTLHAARRITELLEENGNTVTIHRMEKSINPEIPEDATVGLAFPVACFSSYPIVLKFIDSLPDGLGRKVFMAATMGGYGFGMEGPVKKCLIKKGYSPIGAGFFVMPGNYNKKEIPVQNNARRVERADIAIAGYVHGLIDGSEVWHNGIGIISNMFWKLAHTRRPWEFFYKMLFPIQVNKKRCIVCGRCLRMCPVGAIKMEGDYPQIDINKCQVCQRCVGFCNQKAIDNYGKQIYPYSSMSYEDFNK